MPQGFFYLDAYSFPSKSEHLICFLKAYLFQRPTYYNLNIWCLCKTRQVRDHCHTSRVWTAFNRTCCFIAHWTSPAVLLLHCFLHNKAFLQLTPQSALTPTTPVCSEPAAMFVTLQPSFPDRLQKCWTVQTRPHQWTKAPSPTRIFCLFNNLTDFLSSTWGHSLFLHSTIVWESQQDWQKSCKWRSTHPPAWISPISQQISAVRWGFSPQNIHGFHYTVPQCVQQHYTFFSISINLTSLNANYLGHSFPEIPQQTLKKLMSCWPNIFSLIFSDCLANLSDRLHTTLRISHLNSLRNVEWMPSGPDDSLLFTLWICFEMYFASSAVAGRSSNKHTRSKREGKKKKQQLPTPRRIQELTSLQAIFSPLSLHVQSSADPAPSLADFPSLTGFAIRYERFLCY